MSVGTFVKYRRPRAKHSQPIAECEMVHRYDPSSNEHPRDWSVASKLPPTTGSGGRRCFRFPSPEGESWWSGAVRFAELVWVVLSQSRTGVLCESRGCILNERISFIFKTLVTKKFALRLSVCISVPFCYYPVVAIFRCYIPHDFLWWRVVSWTRSNVRSPGSYVVLASDCAWIQIKT